MAVTKKTSTLNDWNTGATTNAAIERVMDNAAYTSAHPDDTVVLVGPPRMALGGSTDDTTLGGLAVVGMLQNISVNQSKPFQPLQSIGSSRSFYLGGKAQGSAQIGRLFMNTDNLLKRLYQNVIATTKINPDEKSAFADNPAGDSGTTNYLINLDSEFFLIPFGMGVVFKNKSREAIGGFYMEMCVIPNYTVSVQAGQSMIMEGVSVLFDRLIPMSMAAATNTLTSYYQTMDKTIGADK